MPRFLVKYPKNSNVIKATTNILDAPVVYEATEIQALSFKASWSKMPLTINYTLEVAIDSDFTNIVKEYERYKRH